MPSEEWRQRFRERQAQTCKHYNGASRETCKAGVNYHELVGNDKGWMRRLPCSVGGTFIGTEDVCDCALREFPTAEEVQAEEDGIINGIQNTITARQTITDYLKANNKPLRNVAGQIPCPICKSGTLQFSIAYNGHCHASCSTSGCVSWME